MKRTLFLSSIALAMLAGCPSDPAPLEKNEVCTRYADAMVRRDALCQPERMPDDAHSRERYRLLCEGIVALEGVKDPLGFLEACSSASDQASCIENVSECNGTPGTLAIGSACRFDMQCASGACSSASDECGTCVAALAEGAACDRDGKAPRCMIGTSCVDGTCRKDVARKDGEACSAAYECRSRTCTNGKCAPRPAAGEACAPDALHSCADGLTCVAGGTCAPLPKEGDACLDGNQCATGFLCNSGKCERLRHAKGGEACGGAVVCAAGRCVEGRCPEVLADGAACDDKDDSRTCDELSLCKNGKCAILGTMVCR
jgi:hypothetical protein